MAANISRGVEGDLFNGDPYERAERDGQATTTMKIGHIISARAAKLIWPGIDAPAPGAPGSRDHALLVAFNEVIEQAQGWAEANTGHDLDGLTYDDLTAEESAALLAYLAPTS